MFSVVTTQSVKIHKLAADACQCEFVKVALALTCQCQCSKPPVTPHPGVSRLSGFSRVQRAPARQ
jgi:hypothetical protein